jgi:tetratricopeptide (TPR) repeat protein/DNA-binding CsgD family transcriptional regulator
MSKSKPIIYPPGEILNPALGKSDYEYIILWMLSNNKICEWSDFSAEISESTLSGHLKKLRNKGYIEKPEKGKYLITLQGKDRFNDLSFDKKSGKRRLKYPPKVILKRRNYDHWILWMVYNNYSCKWSDFKQEPLSINQSSLSINLNLLLENGYILRDNKEYIIAPLGKTEYFAVMKLYDLDRQSILEQEKKRIESITEKTREFFTKYKIEDDELQFRFLDHVLKLNYSKVEPMLKNEEYFNKILLFVSSNHPNVYPNCVKPEEFSSKYEIDITTLNYYIREIVENQFFKIKFFKLADDQDGTYYFQKNEPLEKILNAIVEKYITKFTYLNKFQENPTIDIELLLDNILVEVCEKVFNNKLKKSLKTFLPEYIKDLAYRIETEKKLVDSEAKLEGFVWQNIFEEFQTFEPSSQPLGTIDEDEPFYSMDKVIFEVLDVIYFSKLNFLKLQEVQDTYNIRKEENFGKISKFIYKNKVGKAKELYETRSHEVNELNQLILKDLIVTAESNFKESIKLTTEIIEKYPKEYIGYLLQSLTYFTLDNYNEAIRVVERGLDNTPEILLVCQKAQILMKQRDWKNALSIIEELEPKNIDHVLIQRIKFWIQINEWYYGIKNPELTLETINSAIKSNPGDKELKIMKGLFYCKLDRFREAKRLLIKEVDINVLKKNPKIDTAVYFILANSYIARGKFDKALRIANQVLDIYPNHPISYLTKAIVLGYNSIYNFRIQEPNIDSFKGLIKRAIALDINKSHKARYLNFQGYVLLNIKEYDEAIKAVDGAIKIHPNYFYHYFVKIYFLSNSERESEALDLTEEYVNKFPKYKKLLYKNKSIIYWANKQYDKSYEVIDELSKLYPEDLDIINNKVGLLANLNRKDDAIEVAETLITLDPTHGNPYDTYGEILQMFGDYEEAIKKYEEALKIEPTGWFTDQTFIRLGECYEEVGLFDKALEAYKKGKILEERQTPLSRKLFGSKADEKLSNLKTKMNKRINSESS